MSDKDLEEQLKNIETSTDYSFINHNETDHEGYNAFVKNLERRYEEGDKQRSLDIRRANLLKWLEKVPSRWRKASFKTMNDSESAERILKLLKSGQKGFYIAGPHVSGKTFVAYAIIRKLIASGTVKPSEVRVITESDLLALSTGGFESRAEFEKLFNTDYKVFFFDNLGTKANYDMKRELPAIARLIETIYDNSVYLIATSHQSMEYYSEVLSDAAAARLKNMVEDGLVFTGSPIDDSSSSDKSQNKKDPAGWDEN